MDGIENGKVQGSASPHRHQAEIGKVGGKVSKAPDLFLMPQQGLLEADTLGPAGNENVYQ